jgi:hypothetical protein
MAVWLALPSKRPLAEADKYFNKWRERGYRLALLRDEGDGPHPQCDLLVTRSRYPGWGGSANLLGKMLLSRDASCDWVVIAGDDTYPDERDPDKIAAECTAYFGGTFGMMQPCGDPWGEESPIYQRAFPSSPRHIERIAGSPWIGREYFLRVNGGNGPIWPEYMAMYDDEEAQCVATKLGVFWQRRDVTHYHDHWMRQSVRRCPDFSQKWNDRRHFNASRDLFNRRKAAGFPGHEPLPDMAAPVSDLFMSPLPELSPEPEPPSRWVGNQQVIA